MAKIVYNLVNFTMELSSRKSYWFAQTTSALDKRQIILSNEIIKIIWQNNLAFLSFQCG